MASVQQIQVGLDRYRDTALAAFEDNLERIVQKAQAATLQYVLEHLTIEDGMIARTPGNLRIIRRLSQIFMRELDAAGYTALVNAFVAQFPGHLPTIQDTLNTISDAAKTPLPSLGFSTQDLNLFKSVAVSSAKGIQDTIKQEAAKAVSRVMFSLGGMPFKEMVRVIQGGFGMTVGRAKTIADTAQASFYRMAQDRQYEKIEAATKKKLSFRYSGPLDSRCRIFCNDLMRASGSYTREEIAAMDNHQLPNVMVTCGGYNCRHQWLVSF